MRLITEDNIDQVTSLTYSDNIKKLTKNPQINPLKIAEKQTKILEQVRLINYLTRIVMRVRRKNKNRIILQQNF